MHTYSDSYSDFCVYNARKVKKTNCFCRSNCYPFGWVEIPEFSVGYTSQFLKRVTQCYVSPLIDGNCWLLWAKYPHARTEL